MSNISIILGKNRYRDQLVYDIVYENLQTNIYGFGAVIGDVYPYYKYISDNIFIKYKQRKN